MIVPLEVAVLSHAKGRVLFRPDDVESTVDSAGSIEVDVISAKEVAAGKAIDLLKIDTEGSEWDILQEPSLLQRTAHCVLEYHCMNSGQNTELLKKLIENGGHQIVRIKETRKNLGIIWSRSR